MTMSRGGGGDGDGNGDGEVGCCWPTLGGSGEVAARDAMVFARLLRRRKAFVKSVECSSRSSMISTAWEA